MEIDFMVGEVKGEHLRHGQGSGYCRFSHLMPQTGDRIVVEYRAENDCG